ncbi:hypothetical protein F901_03012 [Acinetobacter dispersus]|uniref:Lcl C-terminal domain-containing protein n=1 Tax=Acinetobacter dispersus TaxID=70348 RepID=UPI0002CDA528|nr:DUF1566 domain-containing protein [Acinetobacter dispersus]ENX51824.1 hypothetical protein F901_03012 [Acinetobacter dispersus]
MELLKPHILKIAFTPTLCLILTACGGGGSEGNSDSTSTKPPECTSFQYLDTATNQCKSKTAQVITDLNLPELLLYESATLKAKSNMGLEISYTSQTPEVCRVTNNVVNTFSTGTCTVMATQVGTDKVLPATSISTSNQVKINQIITGLVLPEMTTGEIIVLDALSSANLKISYISQTPQICSVTENTVKGLAVGICTITASQAGSDKVFPALSVTKTNRVDAPAYMFSPLPTTGIFQCGNLYQNFLACDAISLGSLYGLEQDAEIKAGQPMSYILLKQNGEECVKDNVTGLIWEQKTIGGGLRDANQAYTWYNSNNNNNGGFAGSEKIQASTSIKKDCNLSKCNTEAYIAALNTAKYCGYNNWRLPTRTELISIIDYGHAYKSINPIFTNTRAGNFWTNASYPGYSYITFTSDNSEAWSINFWEGGTRADKKDSLQLIRAVRSAQ